MMARSVRRIRSHDHLMGEIADCDKLLHQTRSPKRKLQVVRSDKARLERLMDERLRKAVKQGDL